MSARNGAAKGPAHDTPLPTKPTSSQRTMAALQKDVDGLREEVAETKGLLTQLLQELRVAAIKQMLSTPEGQQAMAEQLANAQPPAG